MSFYGFCNRWRCSRHCASNTQMLFDLLRVNSQRGAEELTVTLYHHSRVCVCAKSDSSIKFDFNKWNPTACARLLSGGAFVFIMVCKPLTKYFHLFASCSWRQKQASANTIRLNFWRSIRRIVVGACCEALRTRRTNSVADTVNYIVFARKLLRRLWSTAAARESLL